SADSDPAVEMVPGRESTRFYNLSFATPSSAARSVEWLALTPLTIESPGRFSSPRAARAHPTSQPYNRRYDARRLPLLPPRRLRWLGRAPSRPPRAALRRRPRLARRRRPHRRLRLPAANP